MGQTWTHHEVEFPLPIVNGLAVAVVPPWILSGVRAFAAYGTVSYGTAARVRRPNGYLLLLKDPYAKVTSCRVSLLVQVRDVDDVPVMVVDDVDCG